MLGPKQLAVANLQYDAAGILRLALEREHISILPRRQHLLMVGDDLADGVYLIAELARLLETKRFGMLRHARSQLFNQLAAAPLQ